MPMELVHVAALAVKTATHASFYSSAESSSEALAWFAVATYDAVFTLSTLVVAWDHISGAAAAKAEVAVWQREKDWVDPTSKPVAASAASSSVKNKVA